MSQTWTGEEPPISKRDADFFDYIVNLEASQYWDKIRAATGRTSFPAHLPRAEVVVVLDSTRRLEEPTVVSIDSLVEAHISGRANVAVIRAARENPERKAILVVMKICAGNSSILFATSSYMEGA